MPDYRLATRRAAQKYNVDPAILEALIGRESGFNPNAHSPAGAQGIAQFMPGTAPGYGVNLHDGRVTDDLEGAAKYIAANLKKTGGNYHEALSIYNSGRVDGYKHIPETEAYVANILSDAKKLRGGSGGSVARGGSGGVSGASGGTSGSKTTQVTTDLSSDLSGLSALQSSLSGSKPVIQSAGLQTPGFAASAPMPKGYAAFAGGGVTPAARPDISSLLSAIQSSGAGEPATTTTSFTSPASSSAAGVSTGKSGTHSVKDVLALKGTTNFDGKKVAAWVGHVLQYARDHGWKGTVNSGYRSDAEQTRIYNSGVRPAAVPKSLGGAGSNHEGTRYPLGAADVSDAQSLSDILKKSPYASILVYAGAKDPVHFSHPHGGSY